MDREIKMTFISHKSAKFVADVHFFAESIGIYSGRARHMLSAYVGRVILQFLRKVAV